MVRPWTTPSMILFIFNPRTAGLVDPWDLPTHLADTLPLL
jgi:hypothetical protein